MRNLTVIARNDQDGFYYKGSVSTPVLDRTDKLVWFHGLPPKMVSYINVIPIAGAIPWGLLWVNDCVLTRVRDSQGWEYYVPGLVVALPNYCHHGPKFYTILIYTHKHVCRERKDIVLIGKEQYKLILDYIWRVANQNVRQSYQSRLLRQRRSKKRRVVRRTSSDSAVNVSDERSNIRPSKQGTSTTELPRTQSAGSSRRPSGQGTSTPEQPRTLPAGSSRRPSGQGISTPEQPRTLSAGSSRRLSGQGTSIPELPRTLSADTPARPSQQSRPSPLSVGAEVLARFQDDGWFYFGLVTRVHEDASYDIVDSTGHTERIHAGDVIDADSCHVGSRQPGDFVLTVHPDYVLSYAPGEIRSVNRQNGAFVTFFDGVEGTIHCNETYKISQQKYEDVVSGINALIISLGDRDLVLRDENTGFYFKRNVEVRGSTSSSLFIQYADNVLEEVSVCHVFYPGKNTSTREPGDWNFLLAPTAEADGIYLPARIVNRDPLMIQECLSNDIRQLDTLEDCFYLSEIYYNNAVKFITSR